MDGTEDTKEIVGSIYSIVGTTSPVICSLKNSLVGITFIKVWTTSRLGNKL